jgi:hypothetical protein
MARHALFETGARRKSLRTDGAQGIGLLSVMLEMLAHGIVHNVEGIAHVLDTRGKTRGRAFCEGSELRQVRNIIGHWILVSRSSCRP